MLQKVKLGSKVRSLGINRLNCAENTKCRAILIDPDPRAKYLTFAEDVRRNVEVDQEAVIKYGFRPYTAYFYLVGKLNTDQMGNIVGDQMEVEYLQLSESLNNEFSDLVNEMGNFTSLAITKVSKKTEKGDFSHLVVKPSNVEIPKAVLEKVNKLKSDSAALESMWDMIDCSTSITIQNYRKLLAEKNGESVPDNKVIPSNKSKQLPNQAVQDTPKQLNSPSPIADDFDLGIDEFTDADFE